MFKGNRDSSPEPGVGQEVGQVKITLKKILYNASKIDFKSDSNNETPAGTSNELYSKPRKNGFNSFFALTTKLLLLVWTVSNRPGENAHLAVI